jgi:hypothetical protein
MARLALCVALVVRKSGVLKNEADIGHSPMSLTSMPPITSAIATVHGPSRHSPPASIETGGADPLVAWPEEPRPLRRPIWVLFFCRGGTLVLARP